MQAQQIIREEDDDIDAREIETPTHSQSSRRWRKQGSNHNNHKEVDEAAEDADGDGEITVMLPDLRSPMLLHWILCPRLYKKRRIEAVGVDAGEDEVDEEEAAQSVSHSVLLLVVANSVDS